MSSIICITPPVQPNSMQVGYVANLHEEILLGCMNGVVLCMGAMPGLLLGCLEAAVAWLHQL
jgi:hypothetical protein